MVTAPTRCATHPRFEKTNQQREVKRREENTNLKCNLHYKRETRRVGRPPASSSSTREQVETETARAQKSSEPHWSICAKCFKIPSGEQNSTLPESSSRRWERAKSVIWRKQRSAGEEYQKAVRESGSWGYESEFWGATEGKEGGLNRFLWTTSAWAADKDAGMLASNEEWIGLAMSYLCPMADNLEYFRSTFVSFLVWNRRKCQLRGWKTEIWAWRWADMRLATSKSTVSNEI